MERLVIFLCLAISCLCFSVPEPADKPAAQTVSRAVMCPPFVGLYVATPRGGAG